MSLMQSFGAMSGPAAYRKLKFGPFELSIGERLLRRQGVALPLGSRALDILIYLAERPGEVIAKQELIDHVWSDVTVEDGSIRVHVAAIRKALGNGQHGNRYRKHQRPGLLVRRHHRPSRRHYGEQERQVQTARQAPGATAMMIDRESVIS